MVALRVCRRAVRLAQVLAVPDAGMLRQIAGRAGLGATGGGHRRGGGRLSFLSTGARAQLLAGGIVRVVLSTDRLLHFLARLSDGAAGLLAAVGFAGGGQDRARNQRGGAHRAERGDVPGAD